MNDDTKELIGAAIRTTLVGMPSLPGMPNFGSMIEQGWSEYRNHQFQQRVEEFFLELKARLESLEELQTSDLKKILNLQSQVALLEEAVSAASREPTREKRDSFVRFYVSAITGKLGQDPDPIRSLLQTLESLTLSDLEVLRKFEKEGFSTGDRLTGTERAPMTRRGFAIESAQAQQKSLAPLKLSIVKLETRGLIEAKTRRAGGAHTDDGMSTPLSQFRRLYWELTYLGQQLIIATSSLKTSN